MFRVSDNGRFSKLPIVTRFIKQMTKVGLQHDIIKGFFSFGLPQQSFGSVFQESDTLDSDDIIHLMEAIETHIHPEDSCHINYVKHYAGEKLSFCTMVIKSGSTSGYCSECDANNAFGDQNSKIIDGIT